MSKENQKTKEAKRCSASDNSELLDNKPEDITGYKTSDLNFALEVYKESAHSLEFGRKIKTKFKNANARDYALIWQAFNIVYANELFVD